MVCPFIPIFGDWRGWMLSISAAVFFASLLLAAEFHPYNTILCTCWRTYYCTPVGRFRAVGSWIDKSGGARGALVEDQVSLLDPVRRKEGKRKGVRSRRGGGSGGKCTPAQTGLGCGDRSGEIIKCLNPRDQYTNAAPLFFFPPPPLALQSPNQLSFSSSIEE